MNKKKIMIVDDEQPIGEMYTEFLSHMEYQACYFTDPVEALHAFNKNSEYWDLFIVDNRMPKMNGIEFIGEIRQVSADIPVILWSGLPLYDSEEIVKELNIDKVLMKPVTFAEMSAAMNSVFEASPN